MIFRVVPQEANRRMKTLIADKFPQTLLGRLMSLGCEVAYHPGASVAELPALAAEAEILVVRGKEGHDRDARGGAETGAGLARGRGRQHD